MSEKYRRVAGGVGGRQRETEGCGGQAEVDNIENEWRVPISCPLWEAGVTEPVSYRRQDGLQIFYSR